MRYQDISLGQKKLAEDTRKYSEGILLKSEAMQEIYITKNSAVYSSSEIQAIKYYLKTCNYKHFLALLSLEQLWSLDRVDKRQVSDILLNCLDHSKISDDYLVLTSLAFENFLFHGSAFLEYYLLYLAEFFQVGNIKPQKVKSIEDKLFKQLNNAPKTFHHKINLTEDFLNNKVFAKTSKLIITPNNWGYVVRKLRNFITHRDRNRPDFSGNKPLYDQLGMTIADWQDLEQLSFGHFCQYIQNGMFEFYPSLSPKLYDIAWKPGPYKSGMFANP